MSDQPSPNGESPCAFCGKRATMVCARCRVVSFCNMTCQRGAWRDHKPLCVTASATLVAAAQPKPSASHVGELPDASMHFSRVIELVLADPKDLHIVGSGMRLLFDISDDKATRDAMVAAGAVVACASALREHAASLCTCVWAVGALERLTKTPSGKEAALASNVITPILTTLFIHGADANVREYALSAVVDISAGPGGAKACFDANALAPLCVSLHVHASNLRLSTLASAAIGNIASRAAGARAVLTANMMPPPVAVLKTHASDEDACASAGSAISNLVSRSPPKPLLNKRGIEAAIAAGAVPHLVAALRTHASSESVVKQACAALACVAEFSHGSAAGLAAAAVAPLVAALQTHLHNVCIVTSACAAVRCLVQDFEEGSDVALFLEAAPSVVSVLCVHAADAYCIEVAANALARLANVARQPALAVDAMAPLVAALSAHVSNSHVCQTASSAIGNLCATGYSEAHEPVGAQAAFSAGALVPLILALRTHVDDLDVCSMVCPAIYNVCALVPAAAAAARSAGAAPLLVRALERHGSADCPGARNIYIALMILGSTDAGEALHALP